MSEKKDIRLRALRERWQILHDEGRLAKALPLMLEAAKLGDVEAQVELGYDYAYGMSGETSQIKALYWWKRAYKRGSWAAAFHLGAYFRDARQWEKAVKWFERAVDAGDDDGLVEIAKIHLRYHGDRAEGLRYLKLAKAARKRLTAPTRKELDELVNREAELTTGDLIYMEAEMLDEHEKYAEALPLLVKGAKLGDSSCQILLGNYLAGGMKGVRRNVAKGMYWYEQVYKNGSAIGAANLANTYLQDENLDEAFRWYERATALGDGSSHLVLAKLWLHRHNNPIKAIEHLNAMFAGPRLYSDADCDEARMMLRRLSKEKQKA